MLVAAALGDRGDAGITLDLLSAAVASAVLTERYKEARSEYRSGGGDACSG